MEAALELRQEQLKVCKLLSKELSAYLIPTESIGRTALELRGLERSHFRIKQAIARGQILEVISRLYVEREYMVEMRRNSLWVHQSGQLILIATIRPHGYGALSVFVELQ